VTGWGQLTRWLPFLRGIPTPADRALALGQREAINEVERDMGGSAPAAAPAPLSEGSEDAQQETSRRRGRRRRRR